MSVPDSKHGLEGAIFGTWQRIPLFWRLQLTGWTVFAILAFPVNLVLSGTVAAALCSFIVRNGFSFALTLGMRAIYRRVYQNHKEPGRIVATVGVVSLAAGLLQLPFHYLLGDLFPFEEKTVFAESIYLAIFYYRTGLFTCWSLLYFVIRQMREGMQRDLQLARAESARRGAELQLLRAQMNPHFLYNSFNTLIADAGKSPQHLKELIRALAEYLRYSLENRNKDLVPLGKEMDAIRSYITVEKARFREKLEIESSVPEETRNQMVPGIVIQPLIENAIKYGLRTSPKPCKVRLVISNPNRNMLRIEVTNTGKWVEPIAVPDGGVGLENLRQRLELIYADRHRFQIEKQDVSVTVRVDIPVAS